VRAKTHPERVAPPVEKIEQRFVVDLFRAVGATVYPMSQYRASHVAIGLPDLYVMHPKAGLAWWFECKRYEALWRDGDAVVAYHPMDRRTWKPKPLAEPQIRFATECRMAGQRHYWGGRREAELALVALGLAEASGDGIRLLARMRGAA